MMLLRHLRYSSFVFASALAACTVVQAGPDENLGSVKQKVTSITTDAAAYGEGQTVNVTFTELPGNAQDWIAIAPSGSPTSSFVKWSYTGGATDGTMPFTNLPAGTWVARAFSNNSFTMVAESAAFTVTRNATTVTSDAAMYTPTGTVVATYANMAGYASDWISLAPAGSPPEQFSRWTYTNGAINGNTSFVLDGTLLGQYVVRAHFNNSFAIAAESAPFTIATGGAATVTTNKGAYAYGEQITISFTNLPGNNADWISIAPQGADARRFGWFEYAMGQTNGSVVAGDNGIPPNVPFGDVLPPGTYVARAYFNDGFTIQGESTAFTVAAPGALPVTLSTNQAAYTGLETIMVTYAGMQGNATDWIGAFRPGDVGLYYIHNGWVYTNGAASGTIALPPLRRGTWDIRAQFNQGYQMQGQAAAITVTTAIAPSAASYTAADPVVLNYGGMGGAQGEWVSIAAQGSPDSSFVVWEYTNRAVTGQYTVAAGTVPPGTYVGRVYQDAGLTKVAESVTFTVTP